MKPIKPVKRILNKTPSTGNKPNNKWEIEYDGQFGGLTGEVIDKYDLDAIKLFISKTLQQQRREILKEMEFNPETDNFELDVVKAEKIFSDLKENKRI